MDLKLGKITQVSWPVSDVDRAVEFFRDKVGLAFLFRPHETMAFFDLGGTRLYVEKAEDLSKASILYLLCEDVALAAAELERRGVEIVSQPHRVAEMPGHDLWMAFFNDPDGHLLALEMQAPKGWKPGA